jgi:hypothetical protein
VLGIGNHELMQRLCPDPISVGDKWEQSSNEA